MDHSVTCPRRQELLIPPDLPPAPSSQLPAVSRGAQLQVSVMAARPVASVDLEESSCVQFAQCPGSQFSVDFHRDLHCLANNHGLLSIFFPQTFLAKWYDQKPSGPGTITLPSVHSLLSASVSRALLSDPLQKLVQLSHLFLEVVSRFFAPQRIERNKQKFRAMDVTQRNSGGKVYLK